MCGQAGRQAGRQAMKVVVVVVAGKARLAGSKSDRVWKGAKWVKQWREYTVYKKNVQSALKSNSLSL